MVIKMRDLLLKKPPLGWNSYDAFDGTINEAHAMANLDVFIEKFKPAGYEYFVIDILWYRKYKNPQFNQYGLMVTTRDKSEVEWELDEYGRFIASPQYFPNGFDAIIKKCLDHGIKFGLHLMRGVPQEAVRRKCPIKGTDGITCDMIANFDPEDACPWSTINYGIDMTKPGASEYYDSVMEQMAEMGVDFIKYDDIEANADEMEAIYQAIDKVDRVMTLSLSLFSYHYMKKQIPLEVYAKSNMMRITHDIWDKQEHIDTSFEAWVQRSLQDKERPEWFFFDLDMIPFGHMRLNFGKTVDVEMADEANMTGEHWCAFTKPQMRTFITQRAMIGSPIFIGGNLPENDEYTNSVLLHQGMLECDQNGVVGHPVSKSGVWHIFRTMGKLDNEGYGWIGVFNRSDNCNQAEFSLERLGLMKNKAYQLVDVWNETEVVLNENGKVVVNLEANDVLLLKYVMNE
ncbi:MAG: glycoside hydrolase family 27 protein [Eubacteriales bacterium]